MYALAIPGTLTAAAARRVPAAHHHPVQITAAAIPRLVYALAIPVTLTVAAVVNAPAARHRHAPITAAAIPRRACVPVSVGSADLIVLRLIPALAKYVDSVSAVFLFSSNNYVMPYYSTDRAFGHVLCR